MQPFHLALCSKTYALFSIYRNAKIARNLIFDFPMEYYAEIRSTALLEYIGEFYIRVP